MRSFAKLHHALRVPRSCWSCQWRNYFVIDDDSIRYHHLERKRQISRYTWCLRRTRKHGRSIRCRRFRPAFHLEGPILACQSARCYVLHCLLLHPSNQGRCSACELQSVVSKDRLLGHLRRLCSHHPHFDSHLRRWNLLCVGISHGNFHARHRRLLHASIPIHRVPGGIVAYDAVYVFSLQISTTS